MKQIKEYKLELMNSQDITLPQGSTILSVSNISGNIVLFAIIDDSIHTIDIYTIKLFSVKSRLVLDLDYVNNRFLGTVVIDSTAYHVFEI